MNEVNSKIVSVVEAKEQEIVKLTNDKKTLIDMQLKHNKVISKIEKLFED